MNSWDKCKNCGGDYALHNYETDQCPRNGVEAPLNRKQEWMTTTFELVDTRDAQIATLRAESAGRLDALNSWQKLWWHICTATGCADYLPSEQNFDAMIDKQIAAIRAAREQLRATSENWREDCLYRADAILSAALGEEAQPDLVAPVSVGQQRNIIDELKEQGVSMDICVDNVSLWWDTMYYKWRVARGFGKSPKSKLYIGDDFWQAFAVLCGAEKERRATDPVEQRTIIDAFADGM